MASNTSASTSDASSADTPSAAAILQLDNFSCERGERLLLASFSLALAAGEGIRIEGPNGSGKTTLLRIIAGLSDRYQGLLSWRGTDVRQRGGASMAAETLYIGHSPGVKSLLTPKENLAWWAAIHVHQPPSAEQLQQALAKVGLARFCDTPCQQLSAGQQRRVALARLYLSQHTLWILDEPFTAIDKQGVTELEQQIARHLKRGGMAIITTHQAMQISSLRQCTLQDFTTNAAQACAE